MAFVLVLLPHEFVILFAHIIVGDTQYQAAAACGSDGQHAIIEEQAGEDFGFGDFLGREGGDQVGDNLRFFGDFT